MRFVDRFVDNHGQPVADVWLRHGPCERVWLVTFMRYDLGYFDDETCRLEPIENPFAPKLLPMSPE